MEVVFLTSICHLTMELAPMVLLDLVVQDLVAKMVSSVAHHLLVNSTPSQALLMELLKVPLPSVAKPDLSLNLELPAVNT